LNKFGQKVKENKKQNKHEKQSERGGALKFGRGEFTGLKLCQPKANPTIASFKLGNFILIVLLVI